MRAAPSLALIAMGTALVVGTDFVLAPVVNVKLMDAVVFTLAFAFGFRVGALVAILSELTWSVVSPWGIAGVVTPFLVGGELLFAIAGWWARKAWGAKVGGIASRSVYVAALMLVCAFLWDFETNAATALVAFGPGVNLQEFVATEVLGIPFALVHEEVDFLLGLLVVPAALVAIPKLAGRIRIG